MVRHGGGNSCCPSIGTIDFLVGVCSSDVVSYYDTQTVTYNYKQEKLTTTSTYRCIAAGLTATKTGTFYWRKCAKT